MKTRAAIIRDAPGRFEVVDLDLDEPRQNEITVQLVAPQGNRTSATAAL
ncbi:MAG: hypothetical protein ABI307_02545 [Mycobacterium sp.]